MYCASDIMGGCMIGRYACILDCVVWMGIVIVYNSIVRWLRIEILEVLGGRRWVMCVALLHFCLAVVKDR